VRAQTLEDVKLFSELTGLTVYKGQLVFSALAGGIGRELMISDGTPDNTILLKDINEGNPNEEVSPESDSSPEGFVEVNNLLVFVADDGIHGREPWVTDGNETQLLKDIRVGNETSGADTSGGVVLSNRLYFTAAIDPNRTDVWFTDGTPQNTAMFKQGPVVDIFTYQNRLYMISVNETDNSPIYLQVTINTIWRTFLCLSLFGIDNASYSLVAH
jgi:ELWxxDGT repeat protein